MEKGQLQGADAWVGTPHSVSRLGAVTLNASMSAPVKVRPSAPSTSCGGEEAVNKLIKNLIHLALS